MEFLYKRKLKYINILGRIKNKNIIEEGFFIIIRLFLTYNSFYYVLSVLFRFISLIIISGDYNNSFMTSNKNNINNKTFQQFIKELTLHNIIKKLNINDMVYMEVCLLILFLFFIRIILYSNVAIKLKNYKYINKWPIPGKYQIILDHIVFLFFPYLLEFLSFSYYIYLFPNNFIIKYDNKNKILLFIIIFINTILIILYNINNYLFIICCNKKYTTNQFEALSRIKNEKDYKNKNRIKYKTSNFNLYIYVVLQNFPLLQNLENYLRNNYKLYFKISISLLLFFIILLLICKKLYEYNYINLINSLIIILIIFCFYSLIIDLILFILKYRLKSSMTEIIYVLEKLFLSYVSYILIIFRVNKFFENKIRQILFQEKNIKTEYYFISAFEYLNEIMLKIKEKNNPEESSLLIYFLNEHINKCNKIDCSCKLLNIFLQKENNANNQSNEKLSKLYIKNLLSILNYLYESAFIEIDYYNKFELTILLAEHYCHLRNNPTMAFSFIISLMIKQRNKFTKFQMIDLYELSQKYIYFMDAKIKYESETKKKDKINSLINKQKFEYYKNYYLNLRLSLKVKNIINNYIDNILKILKYKSIFEETLSFKFDENNETINYVKIKFFNLNSNIENNYNVPNKKLRKKANYNKGIYFCGNSSNLYNIIALLNNVEIYYKNIINSIKTIDMFKDIPIFMIFKYYLFFDIFDGGKIPKEISIKLYTSFTHNKNSHSNSITNHLYILLKKRYFEKYNKDDSKFFAIYEYKKELKTKYFSEELALRLGFQQKDIINEKIDELMPKEFSKSHQNIIKKLLIGEQLESFNLNNKYFFDSNGTLLFPTSSNGIIIYNLSKNLTVISETIFIPENRYNFMLNNNFELIASSKNFENEYLLNQKIFLMYDLKLLDILKIKPEKLNEKFKNEFRIINYQNSIRQIRTEEYFIPQFYVPPGEKNFGMMKSNNFNIKKNSILSKLSNSKKSSYIDISDISYDNEEEKLIAKEKSKMEIINLFIKNVDMIVHKTIYITLNKMKFIENIFKELTKIPDNELMADNDSNEHNLIIGAKNLINKLLLISELSNFLIRIEIRLSYYYDKPFYFISILDENKLKLKIKMTKQFNFEVNNKKKIPTPTINNLERHISKNKTIKKSRNKNINFKENEDDKSNLSSSINNDIYNKSRYEDLEKKMEGDFNLIEQKSIIEKIDKYTDEINRRKFIFIIKLILSFIIICIFIIYILIIYYQKISINITEKILLTYYYNAHTRDVIQNIYSKLIAIFHDISGIIPQSLSSSYQAGILNYSTILREKYHYFNIYYLNYNLDIGHSFNLIYENKIFFKLRGQWKEMVYNSEYSSELDFIIHTICLIDVTMNDELKSDIKNFLFYKEKKNSKERANSSFIKLLFYFCINYEYSYKEIFIEINNEIISSYNNYIDKSMLTYYILEIGGLIFFLIFFITVFIYLYYSNMIIIKNIIFLFLDFSEEQYNKNKNNVVKIITSKLLKFQNLINNFNLNKFKIYSDDLDNINKDNNINEKEKDFIENSIKEKNKNSLFEKKI